MLGRGGAYSARLYCGASMVTDNPRGTCESRIKIWSVKCCPYRKTPKRTSPKTMRCGFLLSSFVQGGKERGLQKTMPSKFTRSVLERRMGFTTDCKQHISGDEGSARCVLCQNVVMRPHRPHRTASPLWN